ncbi:hypothetical protein BT96DRAFT_533414 [Gymnopus androsaceus JB14]|uniref:Uncharacterized protein n=1 Tax=Gymnopus androsaceus JB14 TaxID=1447944 RepID=A0A6A4IMR4_9AGAR|nr:hypothetical protein BT96DRAFT_533414 [Gymnopus androsaceus JB14]
MLFPLLTVLVVASSANAQFGDDNNNNFNHNTTTRIIAGIVVVVLFLIALSLLSISYRRRQRRRLLAPTIALTRPPPPPGYWSSAQGPGGPTPFEHQTPYYSPGYAPQQYPAHTGYDATPGIFSPPTGLPPGLPKEGYASGGYASPPSHVGYGAGYGEGSTTSPPYDGYLPPLGPPPQAHVSDSKA